MDFTLLKNIISVIPTDVLIVVLPLIFVPIGCFFVYYKINKDTNVRKTNRDNEISELKVRTDVNERDVCEIKKRIKENEKTMDEHSTNIKLIEQRVTAVEKLTDEVRGLNVSVSKIAGYMEGKFEK